MKYINTLKISFKQFISLDLNELKKIKIDNFIIEQLQKEIFLLKDEIKNDLKKIGDFVKNNPDDFLEINNFYNYYLKVLYQYLIYIYKNDLIHLIEDKKIILRSPQFCYFIFEERSDNNERISIFKDFKDEELIKIILKDTYIAFKYAFNFVLYKPWEEFEKSPSFNYFDPEDNGLIDLQVAYLKSVYNRYSFEINDKDEVFKRLIENPNRKELFDKILKSKYSRDKKFQILPDIQSNNLMKHIIENHMDMFKQYYHYLKNKDNIDIEKIDDIIFNDKKATLIWFMISSNAFKTSSYLKNRERIEDLFIKDLPSLYDYIMFLLMKDKKYYTDFLNRRLKDIIETILKINDESELFTFLNRFYGIIGSHIDEKFNFKKVRDREMKKFPGFIEHVSKFKKTLNQYNKFINKT